MADAADEGDLVGLELHARAAAVAEAAAGQFGGHGAGGELDARGQAVEGDHEFGSV